MSEHRCRSLLRNTSRGSESSTISSRAVSIHARFQPQAVTTHVGRVRHHHVAVHKDLGDVLLDASEDRCAHGDVGHKVTRVSSAQSGPIVPVHDVWPLAKPLPVLLQRTHVQPVGAVVDHALALSAEVGEVGLES